MLNMTKVELELISPADMYLFSEKGMRGGLSHISKKYSQANNKYLKSYDPKQEWKHIIYIDANDLYGYVMSKFIPTSGFKQIDPKLHNEYLLAPDQVEIKKEISNYQLKIADFYNFPIGTGKKLVSNLFDKETYVLHY